MLAFSAENCLVIENGFSTCVTLMIRQVSLIGKYMRVFSVQMFSGNLDLEKFSDAKRLPVVPITQLWSCC